MCGLDAEDAISLDYHYASLLTRCLACIVLKAHSCDACPIVLLAVMT